MQAPLMIPNGAKTSRSAIANAIKWQQRDNIRQFKYYAREIGLSEVQIKALVNSIPRRYRG